MMDGIPPGEVLVRQEAGQLVAILPDGRQLADADPIQLADQLLSECFIVDQVRVLNADQQVDTQANGMLIALFFRLRHGPTFTIEPRPDDKGGGWRHDYWMKRRSKAAASFRP